MRGRDVALGLDQRGLGFLANDVVAQLDALVADEHGWAGDELTDLVLRFTAERAVKSALRIAAAQLGHIVLHSRAARVGRYPTLLLASGKAVKLAHKALPPGYRSFLDIWWPQHSCKGTTPPADRQTPEVLCATGGLCMIRRYHTNFASVDSVRTPSSAMT